MRLDSLQKHENFLFKRVLHHLKTSTIQSFSLFLSKYYDDEDISQWKSALSNRRVKELCIDSTEKPHISMHSLWKIQLQSLEKLLLHVKGCEIRFPTFGCLSSLTILELWGITFTCDSSNDLQRLTLNFPFRGESKEQTGLLACELTKNFNNNVEYLTFERSGVLASTVIPQFTILTCLQLRYVSGKILLDLLQKTPLLKTLILEAGLLQFDEELSKPHMCLHVLNLTLKC
ncbi:hypothetical protein VNO78_16252 [Psophocarpus tetragonolobus]|uniref:Uncharacterized protein n=1 Tax=Psophocarpus tetragonolobus TaxID=3891 RepID=A0AAN9SLZ2_PSOTE